MNTRPASVFPEKFQILSGSALKMIAIITMFIDHTAAILLTQYPPAMQPMNAVNGSSVFLPDASLYRICRDIGRVALPIFCFLLVEGFLHTRDRRKYGRNLFLFACLSEIPWNFMHTNTWNMRSKMCFLHYSWDIWLSAPLNISEKTCWQLLSVLGLLWVSTVLNADHGWKGYVFLLIMYWFRNEKAGQAVVGSAWLYYEWKACFAFLSINMYNGKRGFIKGKWAKYFFYAFYPVHIILLVLLRQWLFFA